MQRSLSRSPSPSSTVFFDALSEQLSTSPDVHSSRELSASLVYGEKPPWGWDYVFVFPLPPSLQRRLQHDDATVVPPLHSAQLEEDQRRIQQRVDILTRLKSAGFVFSQLLVRTEQLIMLRMSLPEHQLKQSAQQIGMELRLGAQYGGGYLPFTVDRQHAFINAELEKQTSCYFAPADRSLLLMNVLQSKEHWGCALNIERLLMDGTIVQAFALHSVPERRQLIRSVVWEQWWNAARQPPFHLLKDYLGARVTFYFVFVSFYARRLLPLAVLSVPVYVVYRSVVNEEVLNIVRWMFAVGLVLWTTYFLENWKRRTALINTHWGLHDYKDDTADDTRVQFQGEARYGFYCKGGFVPLDDLAVSDTHSVEREEQGMQPGAQANLQLPTNAYQEPRRARNAKLMSVGVTALFVVLVGALTFLLLWFRNDIVRWSEGRMSGWFAKALPGVLNGVLIFVFDSIWRHVSLVLTRRENHRTNQKFENSLIYKRFAFMFVSNYISLLYIAFVRKYLRDTCPVEGGVGMQSGCMRELETQMLSLVLTKATLGQAMELGVPWITSGIKQWQARWRSRDARNDDATQDESPAQLVVSHARNRYVYESKLGKYESTMEDYSELVIQFGFLVLFGVAFPLASVINLVNNMLEVRTDAYKILVLSQRVDADDAADIGAWYAILETLNVLSVWTNVALLVFTSDAVEVMWRGVASTPLDRWQKLLYRVVAFFVVEHVLLGIKAGVASLVRDIPRRTLRRIARQQFDIARCFNERWRDAYRGSSLLQVSREQQQQASRYAHVFDVASDDDVY